MQSGLTIEVNYTVEIYVAHGMYALQIILRKMFVARKGIEIGLG